MNNIKPSIQISILILISLILRIIAFYLVGDHQLENEWKILVHNLSEKGILGYYVVEEGLRILPKLAEGNDIVLPSAFMPPLYAFFIFIIKYFFFDYINFVTLIILFQICFSLVSIYYFFKLVRLSENQNISIFIAFIFAVIPIHVYACVQISSICIQVFLLTYYFYLIKIFSMTKKMSMKHLIFFSIVSGFLILLRGEFILFFIFTLIYFFILYTKNIKLFFISIILTLLVVSPYLVRNYYQFNTLTITKSFGYNLLKGNNPDFKVEGNPTYIENKYKRSNLNITFDNNFEINLDNFYKEKALDYIKSDFSKYFKNYIIKTISFMTINFNSSYENYYNVYHIFPKLLIGILSLIGGLMVINKKSYLQFLSLYFFFNIFFFSIFFILPRYSLILLPIQMILALEFIKYLIRKIFN